MSAKKPEKKITTDSVIAKSDDGTIQITFTIPYAQIQKAQESVAKEYVKTADIPGFRKGKAPIDKVIAAIPENTLLEKSLSTLLPQLLSDAITEHDLKPAIYPKFELVKAQPNEDWQIRAITCEIPKVELGDYKNDLSGLGRSKSLWTPGSDKDKKEPSREEKEQEVIKMLLEKANINIPKILLEEEVNSRLSNLLQRIEKLGLSLESYLASIGKTADTLRKEYKNQASDAISLDLILNEVSLKENVSVDPKDIDSAIKAAEADPKLAKELDTPDRRKYIESIIKRRKVLDSLIALV